MAATAQSPTDLRLAPGYDLKTGIDAKAEALARVEAATLAVTTIEARLRANELLSRGLAAWAKGDGAKTAQHALAATEADPDNAQAYHLLAIALEKLGYLHKALVTYEKAFSLNPDDTDLILNLGLTAWNIGHLTGAERMFRLFIDKRPDHPAGYNNLGSVQRDLGHLDVAIDTLKAAIGTMPGEAMLWNTLATTLAEEGRAEESLVFYQEALRLKPRYSRVWHNLGYSYMHLARLGDALHAYDRTLKLTKHSSERREAKHSRSICLIGLGKIQEGFKDYEVRHDPQFRSSVIHYTKAPVWKGQPLEGKRILLVGEQGLGDEVMFANIIPDIAKAVGDKGKLQIAVDPRLIPLFQRSFPNAEVGDYDDRRTEAKFIRIFEWAKKDGEPDYYAPFGTPLQFLRKKISDFPKRQFLVADPAKVAEHRAKLASFGPGPYVGICWRSMMLGLLRHKYYSAIDAWKPILDVPGVTFVNLQYGDCDKELERARDVLGANIHRIPELDLRNDIEGASALTAACDLTISAPTCAAALAGALGKPVWFVQAGPGGWPQLGTDHYPWYAKSTSFSPEKFADWTGLLPRVAAALEKFAQAPALCA